MKAPSSRLVLENDSVAWHWNWTGGRLRATRFLNRRSGLPFDLSQVTELALVFSAAPDRLAEPPGRVEHFKLVTARRRSATHAVFTLRCARPRLTVTLHCELDGPTRRKWAEIRNVSRRDLLLLDVQLDAFTTEAAVAGGGAGQPVFLEDEVFAAVEHPAAENHAQAGRVTLTHFPGRRLAPGARYRSRTALVSVAAPRGARSHFLDYLEAHSRPRPAQMSVYTPFGINNQWGAAPTLTDEEIHYVVDRIKGMRRHGVKPDFFTLDTGWVDYASDLTRFRPVAFPHGPQAMIKAVRSAGMKFGLWFATSWGLQSCWDFPGAFKDGHPPLQKYREGYALGADGLTFCFGEETYFPVLRRAVLHHVKHHHVRLLKFDGGSYQCDHVDHGHLPGRYSTEAMHDQLIALAGEARAIAPDVVILWYWGLRSPFWALHGDAIFESGLHMEGSATSSTPALHYRDSVTLALDQNTRNARNVPHRFKDSLGVWLSHTYWGNFMAADRWREALVMDLGRGTRLFPNLWGNLHDLSDDDLAFLGWITAFARRHAALFRRRHLLPGDPFHNDAYGYAYGRGTRGLVFLNNTHFTARRVRVMLDGSIGLGGRPGTRLSVLAHFPERQELRRADGAVCRIGDALELWLRPFEVLMLEIAPAAGGRSGRLPRRDVDAGNAASFGRPLPLQPAELDPRMQVIFADAEAFKAKGLQHQVRAFTATLDALEGPQPVLAVVVRLRRGTAEHKVTPTVVHYTQIQLRIGGEMVQTIPVPESRQYGNTQSFGCSWMLGKVRLGSGHAGQPLQIAVHANVPEGVEAVVEAWITGRWWQESGRPIPDNYHTWAPS